MQTWTKEQIKEKLLSDNKWLIRGMLAIYKKQTDDEKQSGITAYDNGVGFNGIDAELLTNFSLQYISFRSLSAKQIEIMRKKMPKYAGQLAKIANGLV